MLTPLSLSQSHFAPLLIVLPFTNVTGTVLFSLVDFFVSSSLQPLFPPGL